MQAPRPFRTPFLTSIALLAFSGLASAQLPGESVFNPRTNLRQEFLSQAYPQLKAALADWRELCAKRDLKGLRKMAMEEAALSPIEGWVAKGRETFMDSLTARLPRVTGYWLTPDDFDASSNLAFVQGTFGYDLRDARSTTSIRGYFVMVLYDQGGRWMVRSYLERRSP